MGILIQEITNRHKWNEFLLGQSQGHLLQSYDWGELHRSLGARVFRLGALEQGRLVGAMQLSVSTLPVPLPGLGRCFTWMYCGRGPVVEEAFSPAITALMEQAHKIARQERAIVLRLEPNIVVDAPDIDDWMAVYQRLGFHSIPISIHGRRSWVLDLRPSQEELFANFRKAWKYNIRLAEREGMRVRIAESDADVDAYYDLLRITSLRDGFFIHSKEYHKEVLARFVPKGDGVLLLAELDGKPLAAKVLIKFGNCCWDMFGASANERPDLPKTHLIQYHSLQWAKAQGCTLFDFRTIPEVLEPGAEQWGVYHFKKGFGGFSRLHMPTQDYVYQALPYHLWRMLADLRRGYRQRMRNPQKAL